MEAARAKNMERFSGVNTVDSPDRLFPIIAAHAYVFPLLQTNNILIDNTFKVASRPGYGDPLVNGTTIRSLWSDGVKCFYVDGTALYQLAADYTATAIRNDIPGNEQVSYAPFNDRVYYTNPQQIGYVEKFLDNVLPDPAQNFKLPLPPGRFIEVFRGCILVAVGPILYISDPLCSHYDTRLGYRRFASDITMLRAVDDGIYVSDSERVWFLKGLANEDFYRNEAYPFPAVAFSDVKVSGKLIVETLKKNVAIWTSANGICIGDNNGAVVNMTEARYAISAHTNGAAFLRMAGGVNHYINSLF
jgi:hypothetical protein